MTPHKPEDDTPELAKAIDMLREIYWREYERGWRDAVAHIQQQILPQPVPPISDDDEGSLK